jgi:hypothetical protein
VPDELAQLKRTIFEKKTFNQIHFLNIDQKNRARGPPGWDPRFSLAGGWLVTEPRGCGRRSSRRGAQSLAKLPGRHRQPASGLHANESLARTSRAPSASAGGGAVGFSYAALRCAALHTLAVPGGD